ncbi:hypothetical protein Esti_003472 [Eimeria stiedai]
MDCEFSAGYSFGSPLNSWRTKTSFSAVTQQHQPLLHPPFLFQSTQPNEFSALALATLCSEPISQQQPSSSCSCFYAAKHPALELQQYNVCSPVALTTPLHYQQQQQQAFGLRPPSVAVPLVSLQYDTCYRGCGASCCTSALSAAAATAAAPAAAAAGAAAPGSGSPVLTCLRQTDYQQQGFDAFGGPAVVQPQIHETAAPIFVSPTFKEAPHPSSIACHQAGCLCSAGQQPHQLPLQQHPQQPPQHQQQVQQQQLLLQQQQPVAYMRAGCYGFVSSSCPSSSCCCSGGLANHQPQPVLLGDYMQQQQQQRDIQHSAESCFLGLEPVNSSACLSSSYVPSQQEQQQQIVLLPPSQPCLQKVATPVACAPVAQVNMEVCCMQQQQQPLHRSLSDGSTASSLCDRRGSEQGFGTACSGAVSVTTSSTYNNSSSASNCCYSCRSCFCSSPPCSPCRVGLSYGSCSPQQLLPSEPYAVAAALPVSVLDADLAQQLGSSPEGQEPQQQQHEGPGSSPVCGLNVLLPPAAAAVGPPGRSSLAEVTPIVGVGGLPCLPSGRRSKTAVGAAAHAGAAAAATAAAAGTQWYPGFNSPLGKEGRAELIKRMRVVHRNHRAFCSGTLSALGICFRRLAHATVEELWQLAYQWGLFDFALKAARKSAHWAQHGSHRRSRVKQQVPFDQQLPEKQEQQELQEQQQQQQPKLAGDMVDVAVDAAADAAWNSCSSSSSSNEDDSSASENQQEDPAGFSVVEEVVVSLREDEVAAAFRASEEDLSKGAP